MHVPPVLTVSNGPVNGAEPTTAAAAPPADSPSGPADSLPPEDLTNVGTDKSEQATIAGPHEVPPPGAFEAAVPSPAIDTADTAEVDTTGDSDTTADVDATDEGAARTILASEPADGGPAPDSRSPTRRNAPDTGFWTAPRAVGSEFAEPPLVRAPGRRAGRKVPAQVALADPEPDTLLDEDVHVFRPAGPADRGNRRARSAVISTGPRHRKPPRRPALGLPALIVFAFAAAFFAWVSATPLLLTLGHARAGTATVASCDVHGISRQCAQFSAADRSFTTAVTLLGPAADQARTGQKLAAVVVSPRSSLAYAGDRTDLVVRWVPGLVLLLLCGFGIAWATGALRLSGRRAKVVALIGSFGGPALLLIGMLAVAW